MPIFLPRVLANKCSDGRKFGGRDHTTVMHAVRKIEELRQSDAAIAEDVELLKRTLES